MLPQPPTPNPTEVTGEFTPVKRDFNDYDSLISELNEPKQEILSSDKVPGQLSDNGSGIYNDQPIVEISPETAAMSGELVANTVDTVISLGASIYAKSEDREQYEAKPKEIANLSKAWAAVASKMNFSIQDSPWFNLILLMIAVYIPIFIKAKGDRREAIVNERLANIEKENALRSAEMLQRIQNLETATPAAAP